MESAQEGKEGGSGMRTRSSIDDPISEKRCFLCDLPLAL